MASAFITKIIIIAVVFKKNINNYPTFINTQTTFTNAHHYSNI